MLAPIVAISRFHRILTEEISYQLSEFAVFSCSTDVDLVRPDGKQLAVVNPDGHRSDEPYYVFQLCLELFFLEDEVCFKSYVEHLMYLKDSSVAKIDFQVREMVKDLKHDAQHQAKG